MSHRNSHHADHSSELHGRRPTSYRYVGGTIDKREAGGASSGKSESTPSSSAASGDSESTIDIELDAAELFDDSRSGEFAKVEAVQNGSTQTEASGKNEPATRRESKGRDGPPGGGGSNGGAAKKNGARDSQSGNGAAGEVESSGVPRWIIPILETAQQRGVEKARLACALSPEKSRIAVGEEMVRAAAVRGGMFGAAAGGATIFSLPIGFPAGVAAALFAEVELIFSLLALYELEVVGDEGRSRLASLWLGEGSAGGPKNAVVQLTAELLGKAMAAALPARLLLRFEPVLVRALFKRLGLGFVPRLLRMWPILGAPLAFAFDRAALRALGNATLVTLASGESEPRQTH